METKKIIELKDDELENVNGGGGGIVPFGGFTFSPYSVVETDHYYSKYENLSDVVYVYGLYENKRYTKEEFIVDEFGFNWSSTGIADGGAVDDNFKTLYPYVLNITRLENRGY